MKLLLDGRVFSLQTKGGVSQLWARIIGSDTFKQYFKITLFLYPRHEKNIHLLESGLLNERVIAKVYCDIPPSDNYNYACKKSSEYRSDLISATGSDLLPDIVINSYYGENIYPECTRYLIIAHDFAHEDLPLLRAKDSTVNVINRKRESLETSTDLIYISGFTRCRAVSLYPYLLAKRSKVIYHGHDSLQLGANKRPNSFVHIGTRGGYKNFDTVVKAFSSLLSEIPTVNLSILGGEPADSLVSNLLDLYPSQVFFKTDISDHQIMSGIAASEYFISASSYEGFGIPVLNALHLGTKPVLSNIPPYTEIAYHFGHFFSPQDPNQLQALVTELCSGGLGLIPNSNRTWERVASDYASFILCR